MKKNNLSIDESKEFIDNLEKTLEANNKALFIEQMEKIGSIKKLKYGDFTRKPYVSISIALTQESIDSDYTPLGVALYQKYITLEECETKKEKFVNNLYNKYISILLNAGADINIAENVEIISLYASELSESLS